MQEASRVMPKGAATDGSGVGSDAQRRGRSGEQARLAQVRLSKPKVQGTDPVLLEARPRRRACHRLNEVEQAAVLHRLPGVRRAGKSGNGSEVSEASVGTSCAAAPPDAGRAAPGRRGSIP